ncbi:MAG TPA: hypothetical protein VIU85_05290 [Chthoniobacterales bacterium]
MDLNPQEQSVVRKLGETKSNAVSVLLRSSIYCTALAGLFLYLALARNEPRYAIGIFGMFVLYLAIRVYSARRVAGIMPRILQQYQFRIAELEARLRKFEGDRPPPTGEGS